MLGDDAVEVLRPCRPAFDIPRVLVTVLVAQHRGLAGRVGARGMPGVLAAGVQVAFQGGLEGRGGVALLQWTVACVHDFNSCLLYTSPSPRDVEESRMPSSA